jgi:starch synthase
LSRRNRKKSLRWVLVSPEAAPYGGRSELALSAGALAARLHDRGWDVELVIADGPGPRGSDLVRGHARREPLVAELGGETFRGDLWRCTGQEDLPVTVVTCEALFAAPRADDPALDEARLGFLAKAAIEIARRGSRPADVLHLFGARTALAAAFLDAGPPGLEATRVVFSFVDLQDDVLLDRLAADRLGLPPGVLQPQLAEHHGRLSLLKTGLVFADALVAASPRYAREASAAAAGHGFEALLAERAGELSGIASGLEESWDPTRDSDLAAAFSPEKLGGRARCRAALQAELGLGKSARSPVAAFVGELSRERGFDLVISALPELRAAGAQLVIAGRGEAILEQQALQAAREHPLHVAAVLDVDEGLERRILAGADLYLAPHRSAPSALGTARALRYGALPVAHAVGALADLVKPARDKEGEVAAGANGFVFRTASVPALVRAVTRAAAVLADPKATAALRGAAMETPVGWAGAVRRYEELVNGLGKREARRLVIPAPAPAPEVTSAPPAPGEPYIDWGPALAERYGEDALALLVQGPRSVYAYWEVSPSSYARAGGGPLELRVAGGASLAGGLNDFGEYWFEAEPGSRLAVELVDSTGRVLLRSAPAETPREGPSEATAVREVARDRRRRGEIAIEPSPPVPQPLYHFAADGPVSRFGPNAWQERAARPAESPAGVTSAPAAAPRPAPIQAKPPAAAAPADPPHAVELRGGSSPAGGAPPTVAPGSSELQVRRDPR